MTTNAGALPDIDVLVDHSLRLGSDVRLTQGAGGNLSAKADGVMWIKASGTRLAEAADRQIFVAMHEAQTRAAVLVTEDLAPCVVPGQDPRLRPSIETALHVLLPHRFVFHVHAIGTIAAGLGDDVGEVVATLPTSFDTVVVPYAKPGIELARAVLEAGLPSHVPGRALVLVLRNHGLVVGADDAETVTQVMSTVEDSLRLVPAPLRDALSRADVPDGYDPVLAAGTVDERSRAVLCAGPLTPDSAVFLGPEPFGAGAQDAARRHSALIRGDGSVVVHADLGTDEREIVVSLVDAARQSRTRSRVSALSGAQVDELVNWEAEKWRRNQKR